MSNATDDARIAELRDTMTTKQFKLCEAILSGKRTNEAGQIAGYASPESTANALKHVSVSEYISLCRKKASTNAVMSREDGCRAAADIVNGRGRFKGAKASEATPALTFLAKVNGWFEPEKQEVSGSLVDRIRNGRST